MYKRPVLAAVFSVQVLFALACTGAGHDSGGNTAGDDTVLDDTPAPTTPEREDLADDGRCDWLGAPFASAIDDSVYVLRLTDLNEDCNGSNEADEKVICRIQDGMVQAFLDVGGLDDVRMMEVDAGVIVLADDRTGEGELAWLIDRTTGEVLLENSFPGPITHTLTSPDRTLIATHTRISAGVMVQVLDPETLTLTALTVAGTSATYTWLEGRQLATVEYDEEGARISLWDLSDGVPLTPTVEVEVPGLLPNLLGVQPSMALSPDKQTLVFDGWHNEDELIVFDRETQSFDRVQGVAGPLAFAGDGSIVGRQFGYLKIVDPVTLEVRTVETGGPSSFVTSATSGHAVTGDPTVDVTLHIDLETLETIEIPHALDRHTRRDDLLWMASPEGVAVIDLVAGEVTVIERPESRHTVWLPGLDLIYIDEAQAPNVHFLDPLTGVVTASATLSGDSLGTPIRLETF